jgi:hypothetical protein
MNALLLEFSLPPVSSNEELRELLRDGVVSFCCELVAHSDLYVDTDTMIPCMQAISINVCCYIMACRQLRATD